jgi:hypothetical protein
MQLDVCKEQETELEAFSPMSRHSGVKGHLLEITAEGPLRRKSKNSS